MAKGSDPGAAVIFGAAILAAVGAFWRWFTVLFRLQKALEAVPEIETRLQGVCRRLEVAEERLNRLTGILEASGKVVEAIQKLERDMSVMQNDVRWICATMDDQRNRGRRDDGEGRRQGAE